MSHLPMLGNHVARCMCFQKMVAHTEKEFGEDWECVMLDGIRFLLAKACNIIEADRLVLLLSRYA